MHVPSRLTQPPPTLQVFRLHVKENTRLCSYEKLLRMLVCYLYEAANMFYSVTVDVFENKHRGMKGCRESVRK